MTALAYCESRAVGNALQSFAVSVAIVRESLTLLKVAKPRCTFFEKVHVSNPSTFESATTLNQGPKATQSSGETDGPEGARWPRISGNGQVQCLESVKGCAASSHCCFTWSLDKHVRAQMLQTCRSGSLLTLRSPDTASCCAGILYGSSLL